MSFRFAHSNTGSTPVLTVRALLAFLLLLAPAFPLGAQPLPASEAETGRLIQSLIQRLEAQEAEMAELRQTVGTLREELAEARETAEAAAEVAGRLASEAGQQTEQLGDLQERLGTVGETADENVERLEVAESEIGVNEQDIDELDHRVVPVEQWQERQFTFREETRLGNVTSRFDAKLYGKIKIDGSYDSQQTSPGDLAFFVMPKESGGNDDEFNLTAKETRLGLEFAGPDSPHWEELSGRFEMDFYGSDSETNPNPRLRLAYVDFSLREGLHLRAGQDWDTQITALPRTLDFATLANSGSLWNRRPQVRLTWSQEVESGDQVTLMGAIARTGGAGLEVGQDPGAESGVPSFQFNGQYVTERLGLGGPATFSVSGHFGRESFEMDDLDMDINSWSLIGTAILPLRADLTFKGSFWYGENLDDVRGGIGQGVNLVAGSAVEAFGGWAQFGYAAGTVVDLNLFAGFDNPRNKDLLPGWRELNVTLGANVLYHATEATTFGVEVSHMDTDYVGLGSAPNLRVQTSIIFLF